MHFLLQYLGLHIQPSKSSLQATYDISSCLVEELHSKPYFEGSCMEKKGKEGKGKKRNKIKKRREDAERKSGSNKINHLLLPSMTRSS